MIEHLTKITEFNGETVYADSDIRSTVTHLFDLDVGPGGLLAVVEDELKVEYALFEFSSGDADGTHWQCVFHGTGFAGALREMRHTYWGDEGYTFYLSMTLVAQAFTILRRWFDD